MNPFLKFLASLGLCTLLAVCPCCSMRSDAERSLRQTDPALSTVTLTIDGMTCASCSVAVRTTLKKLDGVRDARVSVEKKQAVVDYETAKVTPQRMIGAVNRLGYRAGVAPNAS